jgi:hypothetical protein
MASSIQMARKSDVNEFHIMSPKNILGGEYKPKGAQNGLSERDNPQERSH